MRAPSRPTSKVPTNKLGPVARSNKAVISKAPIAKGTVSKLRTPTFTGQQARDKASGGTYTDKKTGRVNRFAKQYKS